MHKKFTFIHTQKFERISNLDTFLMIVGLENCGVLICPDWIAFLIIAYPKEATLYIRRRGPEAFINYSSAPHDTNIPSSKGEIFRGWI